MLGLSLLSSPLSLGPLSFSETSIGILKTSHTYPKVHIHGNPKPMEPEKED